MGKNEKNGEKIVTKIVDGQTDTVSYRAVVD